MAAALARLAAKGGSKAASKGASRAASKGASRTASKGASLTASKGASRAASKGGGDDMGGALGAGAAAVGAGAMDAAPSGFTTGGGVGSCPIPPATKINIQISGSDMAASSGVFAETVGGPPDDDGEGGVSTTDTAAKKPATKKPAAKKPAAKKPATKRKSKFTLEGSPVTSGDDIAWALIGFILVALLIFL